MFPNVRLMIVAVFASIMGISCALGLFAEFRVSHDSFLRESNANAPLQLGTGTVVPAAMSTTLPFRFRLEANAPPSAPETAVGPGNAGAKADADPAKAAAVAAPAAPTASSTSPAAPDTAVASAPAPAAPSASAGPPAASEPTASAPAAGENLPPDAATTGVGTVAVQTPADRPPLPETTPNQTIKPDGAKTPAPAANARSTVHRRPVIARRVQRLRPAPALQVRRNFTTTQPAFQWTQPAGLQPTQPRRVIVRHVRRTPKTAVNGAVPQAAAANSAGPPVSPW
jgi:hypothetical protein